MRALTLALALLVASAAPAGAQSLDHALLGLGAGLVLVDTAQTVGCLQRGICREAMPTMRPLSSRPVLLAGVKLTIDAGVLWSLHKGTHGPSRKVARGVLIGFAVLEGAVVVWNWRQLRRR